MKGIHARCNGVGLGGAHEEDKAEVEGNQEEVEEKTTQAMLTTGVGGRFSEVVEKKKKIYQNTLDS